MQRALAEEIVRQGFDAARPLGALVRMLADRGDDGTGEIARAAAGLIEDVFERIIDPVFDEHPDLEEEIETRIATSGSAFAEKED